MQAVSIDSAAVPGNGAVVADALRLLGSSDGLRRLSRPLPLDPLIPTLQADFDLGRWRVWQRTPKGTSNVSYFVETDDGPIVVRQSNGLKTPPAARFESALLDYLVAQGYPAPRVVRTRSGADYVAVPADPDTGGRDVIFMVTRRLPGDRYDPHDRGRLQAAARALARYHQLVRDLPLSDLRRLPRGSAALAAVGSLGCARLDAVAALCDQRLEAGLAARVRRATLYLRAQTERIAQDLATVYPSLDFLVVHGSFGRSAVLFTGDTVSGVVDFDLASYDLLGLDFAFTFKSFCVMDGVGRSRRLELDPERTRAFLRAYAEVAPLPAADLAALPLVFRAQRLAKVFKKCGNLLAKQAIADQQRKDFAKLAEFLERETARLTWLSDHPEWVALEDE